MELQVKILKYQAVGQKLLKDIHEGKLKPGQRIPGEMEIAKCYSVSRVTARQALSYLEKEGVVRREQGKGTFVDTGSRAKSGGLSDIRQIAFVLVDVSEKLAYNFLQLVTTERFFSEKGIPFSWAILQGKDIIKGAYPAVLEKNMCDGLLLDGHITDAHYAIGEKFGVQTLVVGNHAIRPEIPQVKYKVVSMASKATRFLGQRYSQPVVLLVEPFRLYVTHEINKGYMEGLRSIGQDRDFLYLCSDLDGTKAIERLLNGKQPFSILTTGGILPSVLQAYQKFSLSMEQYPILTIGNKFQMPKLEKRPGLYLMFLNPEEIALTAAQRLVEMIKTGNHNVYEERETEIIEVETSKIDLPGQYSHHTF